MGWDEKLFSILLENKSYEGQLELILSKYRAIIKTSCYLKKKIQMLHHHWVYITMHRLALTAGDRQKK